MEQFQRIIDAYWDFRATLLKEERVMFVSSPMCGVDVTLYPNQFCNVGYSTSWQITRCSSPIRLHCRAVEHSICIGRQWVEVDRQRTDFTITPESLSQVFDAFCQLAQKQAVCATLPMPIADEILQYLRPASG